MNESEIAPALSGLSKTAFYVLVWKNEGSEITYAPPVYKKDPYMAYFLNKKIIDEGKKLLPRPESYRAVQIRRKHIKRTISEALKSPNPPEQLILLGSGLDTLPLYKKQKWTQYVPKLSIFEVDKEEVLNYKEKVIAQYNLPPASSFIKVDYTSDNFIEVLEKHKVNFKLKTHIIWEGNTYYLKHEEIAKVLNTLRKAFFTSYAITFDYFTTTVIKKQTNSKAMDDLQEEFSNMGAKFKAGIDDINTFAKENGYLVIKNYTIPELDKIYFQEKAPEPEPEDHHHLICTIQLNT